ncbi:Ger(x)C family spore germination protein [Caldalkalibacillus salinus]|uniref:Ger(x)C family spore germination protein n=1 Tax=Caldalkalibacillus salinus TaxID=2803787 RepID=UPI001922A988|nr:Ger(x)C family spore germination protein [Caldalkalibacillus salinus]
MRSKLFLVFLLFVFTFSSLTGCWDRRELEERISVIAISIDQAEPTEEGEAMVLVSLQIPIPIKISGGAEGGGAGGMDAVRVISSTGFTVADAFSNLQKRLNQQLFLGHTRVISVSEDLAREGLEEILDGFRRDPALRRLLWFVIVEGKARDMLYSDAKLEQIPMVYIMSLIENGAREQRIPDITLGQFYISESNNAMEPIANYVRAGEEDISWDGTALFNGTKMVGRLNPMESWYMMQLRGEGPGGDRVIHTGDEEHMVIRPKQLSTKKKVSFPKGEVHIHYDISIEANLIEKNFKLDMNRSEELQSLAKIVEKEFEKEAQEVIEILQQEYKTDALRIGRYIKAYHYKEWQAMNWGEEFPKSNITVSYDVAFRRTGMQLN